ncbi:MAG: hypothetical protein RSG59_04030 [Ruthenibacterium sp.]
MPVNEKKQIVYRCPVCFARETDVVLHRAASGDYYCVKCSFTGGEVQIKELYADMKKKYRLRTTRLTLADLEKM